MAIGVKPAKFPPAPVQTQFPSKETDSQISKPWINWFSTIVTGLTKQISQITGLSYQQFTQATLPNLSTNDAGFLVQVTDFGHVLQWTGTGYMWGPGELGSGFIHGFMQAPSVPGWHLCDGSIVPMLNSNGTITQVQLPNLSSAAYLKLATALLLGPNGAKGQTDPTDIGTPSGAISAPTFIGTAGVTGVESADLANVAVTGSSTAAGQNHTHTFTPAGTVTAPAFTGSPLGTHTHGPGSLDLVNCQLLAYFRQ